MKYLPLIIVFFVVVLVFLMCFQESKKRKISLPVALLLCLFLSPIIGYFIIVSRPLRFAKGCNWCDNDRNEVEFCGVCGKNELGETNKLN